MRILPIQPFPKGQARPGIRKQPVFLPRPLSGWHGWQRLLEGRLSGWIYSRFDLPRDSLRSLTWQVGVAMTFPKGQTRRGIRK